MVWLIFIKNTTQFPNPYIIIGFLSNDFRIVTKVSAPQAIFCKAIPDQCIWNFLKHKAWLGFHTGLYIQSRNKLQ